MMLMGATYTGILITFLAGDFITLYLGFELMSLASWGLVVHNQTDESYSAGGMYLYLGVAGGLLILTSLALVYYYTGSFAFDATFPAGAPVEAIALMMIAGFGVKAGMVPRGSPRCPGARQRSAVWDTDQDRCLWYFAHIGADGQPPGHRPQLGGHSLTAGHHHHDLWRGNGPAATRGQAHVGFPQHQSDGLYPHWLRCGSIFGGPGRRGPRWRGLPYDQPLGVQGLAIPHSGLGVHVCPPPEFV